VQFFAGSNDLGIDTTVSLGKAFNLSATASSLNSSIQKVDFLVNGRIETSTVSQRKGSIEHIARHQSLSFDAFRALNSNLRL